MEFSTIKRSDDQKEELLTILRENPYAIIMVGKNWMDDFRARDDIDNYKYELRKPTCNSSIILDIFENSEKGSCQYIGAIEFEYIKGYYFLKGNIMLGYSCKEADKIIFLE